MLTLAPLVPLLRVARHVGELAHAGEAQQAGSRARPPRSPPSALTTTLYSAAPYTLGDGPRSVELRLGEAERYSTDPLVVIAPRVETGSTKLDVYTQWGSKTDLSFVVALKPRRALAQAL